MVYGKSQLKRKNRELMTSRERMLAALGSKEVDYTPCSFMLFFNLYYRSKTEREFVERQLELGLDAYVNVGHLEHSLHPDAKRSEWVEQKNGTEYFCRRIETPKGPLTGRVRKRDNWPQEGNFPLFNDWLVSRAEEILVKPEQDLERLRYIFGPFRDSDIAKLREEAREAKKLADKHSLLQIGGWKPVSQIDLTPNMRGDSDAGVMGCDAMAWLSGYEEIMVLSITKPEVIKEYARIIHEWSMKRIAVYLDVTDADIIWRRGWYETTEFWTPDAYKEIIAPTIKKEAELVHQAGKKYGYIITSAFTPIVDYILDADIDVLIGLDPEEGKGTELGTIKRKFSDRNKAIWGGVSGAATVELGTGAETEEAVTDALRILGEKGGFILSPVDNVREDTDRTWRNTEILIDTWKKCRGH